MMPIAGDAPRREWDNALGHNHETCALARDRTYHPEDPIALWREPDRQRYQLDSFFAKLLKLEETMKT